MPDSRGMGLGWLIVLLATFSSAGAGAATSEKGTRGQWYKGNTHAHSLSSDGDAFPEMIVDWYRQRGYDFLALSEHNSLPEHFVECGFRRSSGGIGIDPMEIAGYFALSDAEDDFLRVKPRWVDVERVIHRADTDEVMKSYLSRFGGDWVETREHNGKQQVRIKSLEEYRSRFEKDGKFLLIQSDEIGDSAGESPVHINAVNVRKVICSQRGQSVREVIRNNLRAIGEHEPTIGEPVLAHINHPNLQSGITAEDLAHVTGAQFFEVYNGNSATHESATEHLSAERMWDVANAIRIGDLAVPPLFGMATDDSHQYHGKQHYGDSPPGRGWVMVRARELSAVALINAMRAGDFYASSGVMLRDVRFDAGRGLFEIEVEPRAGTTYMIEFIGTESSVERIGKPALSEKGEPVRAMRYSPQIGKVFQRVEGTRAEYRMTGKELYVRAVVTADQSPANPSFDGQRAQAWTQPVGWSKSIAR